MKHCPTALSSDPCRNTLIARPGSFGDQLGNAFSYTISEAIEGKKPLFASPLDPARDWPDSSPSPTGRSRIAYWTSTAMSAIQAASSLQKQSAEAAFGIFRILIIRYCFRFRYSDFEFRLRLGRVREVLRVVSRQKSSTHHAGQKRSRGTSGGLEGSSP